MSAHGMSGSEITVFRRFSLAVIHDMLYSASFSLYLMTLSLRVSSDGRNEISGFSVMDGVHAASADGMMGQLKSRGCSTSFPGGYQVDDLPPVRSDS